MSLQRQQIALIPQGWLRALVLLLIYIGLSVGAGFLLPSAELWFAFNLVVSLALVYFFRRVVDRKSFQTIGFGSEKSVPDSLIGLSMGVFLVSTGALLIYYLKGLEWIDIVPASRDMFNSVVILVMVAISEEVVFRGYVLRNLMKSFNKWLALPISALLFTAVHLTNPDVPWTALVNTFLGGMLLGITYIYNRKLWVPVFFHFAWNFMQGPVLGFPVSGLAFNSLLVMETRGSQLISGGNYGFEGSLVCSVLLLTAFVGWGYFERKRSYSSQ